MTTLNIIFLIFIFNFFYRRVNRVDYIYLKRYFISCVCPKWDYVRDAKIFCSHFIIKQLCCYFLGHGYHKSSVRRTFYATPRRSAGAQYCTVPRAVLLVLRRRPRCRECNFPAQLLFSFHDGGLIARANRALGQQLIKLWPQLGVGFKNTKKKRKEKKE
ncbi:hypothetical protein PUN28_017635 [Cardiocondyla obscurior]|uniref:SWIM-type domain-containing protein n=1 Tax=Cardiocondyla obscurior TaxID=286306 RepID=A0AAW2EIE0_9HYME